MYVIHVCYVSMLCMYVMYVCYVCMLCMYVMYVCYVCMLCMYVMYVKAYISITTRSRTIMPETPDVPLEDTKELSIDEKLDKLLTSATVVTQLKTDIDTMATSVKGLTEDLNKLKKKTDAIPNIRTQLKQIQEDITSLKN